MQKLRRGLEVANAVAAGKYEQMKQPNGKLVPVPKDAVGRKRLAVKHSMSEIAGFLACAGFSQELLRPFLWVTNAAADAERGAKNPIFAPPSPPNRGPETDSDTAIIGLACAAVKCLGDKEMTDQDAADYVAKKLARAGITADDRASRRLPGKKIRDKIMTGPRLLRAFYDVKAHAKIPDKERPRNTRHRQMQFFNLALRETAHMDAHQAAETLIGNIIDAYGQTP